MNHHLFYCINVLFPKQMDKRNVYSNLRVIFFIEMESHWIVKKVLEGAVRAQII